MTDITGIIRRNIATALAGIRRPFRAVLSRITTEGGVMTAQLDGLSGETLQAVEVFQHFGFTSVPPENAMAVILPLGGSTSHSVVVATEHSEYRIQSLKPGEVAIYSSDGASITLKDGQAIKATCKTFTLECESAAINASKSIACTTPDFSTSQNATVKGLLTGSGGMSISGDNGSGSAATFAGDISHTSGSISSLSVKINGVEVSGHIHDTPEGKSGPMLAD
ncbi:phage baseplate protein [Erwinia typographi]|uniref:Phage baseplate protein n=1 Tax=Erwinia typographi TaxID=371042 RepID=A0A0A3ZCB4_9GAMM|nr:phage baseplate assembly protein V [Erwinia typographi]KGT95296.1 phage baseplate protein [Erwinia typographi]